MNRHDGAGERHPAYNTSRSQLLKSISEAVEAVDAPCYSKGSDAPDTDFTVDEARHLVASM